MRPIALIVVGAFVISGLSGCKPSMSKGKLREAVASTNDVFLRYTAEPITLTAPQSKSLKRIIRQFANNSVVEVLQQQPLPAPFGHFGCDSVRFAWLESKIYYHDQPSGRYFAVQDITLEKMSQENMKSLGNTLPLHSPTVEDWIRILSTLEQK